MANTTLIEEATAKLNERLSDLEQMSIENIWQFIDRLRKTQLTQTQQMIVNFIEDETIKLNDYRLERI